MNCLRRALKKKLLAGAYRTMKIVKLYSGNETAGDMRESNTRAANQKSKVQCLEVLVSKNAIATNGHNLHWTLSVYSLENHPVNKSLAIQNSEIFHFMVYDWKRTIKRLLDDHKIAYSIIEYFSPETIYAEGMENSRLPVDVAGVTSKPAHKGNPGLVLNEGNLN